MRKACFAAIVSILCLTLSSNYLKAAAESRSLPSLSGILDAAARSVTRQPPSESQQVAVGNSGGRRSLPVLQSLLGQWTTNGGRTHYYLAANQITVINLLGNALKNDPSVSSATPPRQVVQVMKYEVMTVSEPEQVVRLKVQAPLDWLDTMTLRLAPNRQAITELLNIAGHDLSSEWIYVGDQQQP
ncbi:MAG TPA: hypothetical protein V6C57_27325 [Coleofasciculaceae cyanobacterium]